MAGLTRQALRRHPWSFAGPITTQCLAATIVVGALDAQHSFDQAPLDAPARDALNATGVPEIATIFVMISIYLSIIIVGVTMGATIGWQARDIALVRTVGATPGQVRRAIATQAALVAVPATLAGWPLGVLGGRAWVHGLVTHGVIPAAVGFRADSTAGPIALAVTVGTSVVGALIAAVRPSRLRPAIALTQATTALRRTGAVRTTLGLLLVSGGIVLSVVINRMPADKADSAGFFVMLALCVGAGLLGPVLLRWAAPVARLLGPTGTLAADNVMVQAKNLSGALVALLLAVAFAMVKVASHETIQHVTGARASAAELWTEYSGTAVYTGFAAVAALNTLITVTLARRRALAVIRLAGGTRTGVLTIVTCEALIVIVAGLVAGVGIATTTLAPLLHTTIGTRLPWLPAWELVAGVLAVAAVVLAGTVVPAALAMRRPPIEAVEAGT